MPGVDLRRLMPPTLDALDDAVDTSELPDGTDELADLDLHTRLFKSLVVKGLTEWNGNPPTAASVRITTHTGPIECEPAGFGGLQIPSEDEDDELGFDRIVAYRALRSRLMPMCDLDAAWASTDEAVNAFESFLPLGGLLARPNSDWTEMTSDDAQARIAFAGLGALRLAPIRGAAYDPDGARWASDFGWMGDLPVRDGFERYGATAFFDGAQRLVRIRWSHAGVDVRPGDPAWAHAKWVWRSSLVVGTTVADHLVTTHLVVANLLAQSSRSLLGIDHPVRRLLTPFVWRTQYINYSATFSLCPERGFLHRVSALTWPALRTALDTSAKAVRYTTVPRLLAAKAASELGDAFPWATDALALYETLHAFVDDYLALYYPGESAAEDPEIRRFWAFMSEAPPHLGLPDLTRETLTEALATAMWCVSGLHEAVGAVIEYTMHPGFATTKIRPGCEMADVQASIQALLVVALTGLKMPPLMGDYTHLCLDDAGAAAFERFQAALAALSDRIDAANATRRWPCNAFNPRCLESSVSI